MSSFGSLTTHVEDVEESLMLVRACADAHDLAGARDAVARARRYCEKMQDDIEAIEHEEGGE